MAITVSKERLNVTEKDFDQIKDKKPGPVWSAAQALFAQHRFDDFA